MWYICNDYYFDGKIIVVTIKIVVHNKNSCTPYIGGNIIVVSRRLLLQREIWINSITFRLPFKRFAKGSTADVTKICEYSHEQGTKQPTKWDINVFKGKESMQSTSGLCRGCNSLHKPLWGLVYYQHQKTQ